MADKKEKDSTKLPEGLTLDMLKAFWTEANSAYAPVFRRMRIIDATDRGKLWTAIAAKFPTYQILPDTNHVSYVKNNLLASLYTIGRSAHLIPTSIGDVDTVTNLNIALDNIWDSKQIAYHQMLAGERAALLNLGLTQVGWDNSIVQGTGDTFSTGGLAIKNVNPLKFMRDPYAIDLDTAAYCMTWDEFHKNVITRNPLYAHAKDYLDNEAPAPDNSTITLNTDQKTRPTKDYFKVVIMWVLHDSQVHEIHMVNTDHILLVKKSIQPSAYPFADLYCNIPAEDVIGTSEPNKILASSVAINMMNSIAATSVLKNQRPPRFVNKQAQINLREFMAHGSDSDYMFEVQGDASRAVHYHEFPPLPPQLQSIVNTLAMDIQQVTGVDGRYTGKDTGSILTTGGIEQMLDQATLIDQPKIVNYERYTTRLTQLILGNLKAHGHQRKYFMKAKDGKTYDTVDIDFDLITDDTVFDYGINISAHLPKNKQRISQMANVIMEKQMQYGQGQPVSLMTPEEWLRYQDLPFQESMMERMKVERSVDYVAQTMKVLSTYADLIEQGVDPETAMLTTADSIQSGEPPMPPQPQQPMTAQPPMGQPPAPMF
jgi:hypothetical protein